MILNQPTGEWLSPLLCLCNPLDTALPGDGDGMLEGGLFRSLFLPINNSR